MVFYVPPKRVQPARQPDEKASMRDLPDELLLGILNNTVSIADIINVRATCSSVVPACNEVLTDRLKVLYIHPSRASLRAAVNICDHPILSQEIRKVVLLGKVFWTQIEQACPKHRITGLGTLNRSRFRAWPARLPVEIPDSRKYVVPQTAPELDSFPWAYRNLIDALAGLKNATKLEFAEGVKDAGWNVVSQAKLYSHAIKMASEDDGNRDEAVRVAQKKGFKPGKPADRFADSDVFYGLLSHPDLHFTEISLQTELPFIKNALKAPGSVSRLQLSIPGMKQLTSIELTVDLGWPHTDFHTLYRTVINHSRETLQRLKIVLMPNAYVKSAKEDGTLGRVLEQIVCPNLKRLELALGSLTTRGLNKISGRQRKQRPSCQTFEILPFLAQHEQLTHVNFTNITFAHTQISALVHDLADATTRPQKNLQHFSWAINRYTHDPRCKRSDEDPTMTCRKYECGRYHSGGVASLREMWVGQMEMLALQLGVDLGEDMQSWDFGEVVERERRFCGQCEGVRLEEGGRL